MKRKERERHLAKLGISTITDDIKEDNKEKNTDTNRSNWEFQLKIQVSQNFGKVPEPIQTKLSSLMYWFLSKQG